MSNHFHILLGVLKRPAEGLSDAELGARLEGLSEMTEARTIKQRLAWFRERGFVNEVFGVFRDRFWPKRKDGARRMRYVAQGGMYSPRDLQREVVGVG